MKIRGFTGLLAAVSMLLGAEVSEARKIIIEPDMFPAGTDISSKFPFAVLRTFADGPVYSVIEEGCVEVGDYCNGAPTGTRVFGSRLDGNGSGENWVYFPGGDGSADNINDPDFVDPELLNANFRVDLLRAASSVSVLFLATDFVDETYLTVFDKIGSQIFDFDLRSCSSDPSIGPTDLEVRRTTPDYEWVVCRSTVSTMGNDIWSIMATGAGSGTVVDRLVITVTSPSPALLLLIGLPLLAAKRKDMQLVEYNQVAPRSLERLKAPFAY